MTRKRRVHKDLVTADGEPLVPIEDIASALEISRQRVMDVARQHKIPLCRSPCERSSNETNGTATMS